MQILVLFNKVNQETNVCKLNRSVSNWRGIPAITYRRSMRDDNLMLWFWYAVNNIELVIRAPWLGLTIEHIVFYMFYEIILHMCLTYFVLTHVSVMTHTIERVLTGIGHVCPHVKQALHSDDVAADLVEHDMLVEGDDSHQRCVPQPGHADTQHQHQDEGAVEIQGHSIGPSSLKRRWG